MIISKYFINEKYIIKKKEFKMNKISPKENIRLDKEIEREKNINISQKRKKEKKNKKKISRK